ncbi:MAG: integration host factor subunit alpha [Acidithiobacillus sp.]
MTVTKKQLADHLLDTLGLAGRDSKSLVEAFFDTIRQTLASGEEVKLANFGNFEIKDKRARPGRNPKNGTPFKIKARRVVTYHPSPNLRKQCNGVNE